MPLPYCRPILCFTERQATALAAAIVQARIPFEFAGDGEKTRTIDFMIRGEDYARACELAQSADLLWNPEPAPMPRDPSGGVSFFELAQDIARSQQRVISLQDRADGRVISPAAVRPNIHD